jgi:para-nitrobenzyl esterase
VTRRSALFLVALATLVAGCSSGSARTAVNRSTTSAAPAPAPSFDPSVLVGGDPLRVRTPAGAVRGSTTDGVRRFTAVPYAAPPIGANRWRAPQPVTPWSGLRDSTKPAPECTQILPVVNQVQGQEDCLYLNVFAPETPPARLQPVMVWIHGGGFTVGSGNDNDPSRLVARAGVVAVTINYRLGPFGFLAHRALSAADPNHSAGNMGFEDQLAALHWVQRSIAAFGGDARNVTIFGESAGGMSVCDHLLSPRSRGLFAKAIMESGPCGDAGLKIGPAYAQGDTFAAKLGCGGAPDVIGCLRTKSTAQVLTALPPDPTFLFRKAAFWLPVGDGVDLPADGTAAIRAGHFNRVPVIAGVNRDEGRLFIGMAAYTLGSVVPPVTATDYPSRLAAYFGARVGAQVLDRYPLASYPDPGAAFGQAVGDAILACPALAGAEAMEPFVPVHLYEFTHAPNPFVLPMAGIDLGAFHSAELPYVFGKPTASSGRLTFTVAEQHLSDTVVGAWTRFARTGTPNGDGLDWPAAGATRTYLDLDTPTKLGRNLKQSLCGFWARSGWNAAQAGRA